MNKKKKWYVFLTGAILSMFLTVAFLISPYGISAYVGLCRLFRTNTASKLMIIEDIVEKKFMGAVHTDYYTDMAARAFVGSMGDKYSTYFSYNDFKRMSENLSGDYHGIGVTIENKDNRFVITNVKFNSPAEKSGVLEGDILIKVNGEVCQSDSLNKIINTIKNTSEGEEIVLSVERDGSLKDIKVKIENIELDYIKSELLEDKIGYVRIETFGNEVAQEFIDATRALVEKGAKGLIFDVRSNPGGVLETVVEMVDYLIGEGTITTVRQKNGAEQVYTSDEQETDLPMCVLINSESASASEIFSAALSDYNKATLIGEKTYGKGVVQGIYELGDKTAISITIAKYYTPKGQCIDGLGVEPHIWVSLPEDIEVKEYNAHIEGDIQLAKALDVLKNS